MCKFVMRQTGDPEDADQALYQLQGHWRRWFWLQHCLFRRKHSLWRHWVPVSRQVVYRDDNKLPISAADQGVNDFIACQPQPPSLATAARASGASLLLAAETFPRSPAQIAGPPRQDRLPTLPDCPPNSQVWPLQFHLIRLCEYSNLNPF